VPNAAAVFEFRLGRIGTRLLTFPKVAARLGKFALVTFSDWDGIILVLMDGSANMSIAARATSAKELISDSEQKQIALSYLYEAWSEAQLDGVDGDCLAQAALFSALSELVNTYGEDATAKYSEGLSARIRNGEFSILLSRQ
jgi:hypothetical protein